MVHQTPAPAPAPISYPELAVLPGAGVGGRHDMAPFHLSREQLEQLGSLLAIAGGGLGNRAGESEVGSGSGRLRKKIPQFSCPEPDGHFAEPADCGVYYRCVHDTLTRVEFGAGLVWNQASLQCFWEEEVQCQPTPSNTIVTCYMLHDLQERTRKKKYLFW